MLPLMVKYNTDYTNLKYQSTVNLHFIKSSGADLSVTLKGQNENAIFSPKAMTCRFTENNSLKV